MKLIAIFITIHFFLVPGICFANNYKANDGYEVELYWRVKHRRKLIIWGSVEEGKKCKRLKMHIGMKHNDGWYRNFKKTFVNNHEVTSRSAFKLEKKHYKKSLPKKGWYPDYISVTCSRFYKER